ncbi:glycoside hydrolase family 31 protein [Alteriqipengyuania sp. 357]
MARPNFVSAIITSALLGSALSGTALAGDVAPVPHGMVVTTDDGQKVRVLAYGDDTLRITAGETLPEERATAQVVADPDGDPKVTEQGDQAVLRTPEGSATVSYEDGALIVRDAAGKVLLEEHADARRIDPVEVEGQRWYSTRVQFNRGTDEGLYGLGQHQNRQMNYNGEDLELAQHNMAITVPYLVSTRGYGILWDNASITRVGDPEPYEKLQLDWNARYYLGDRMVVEQAENAIDYKYLSDQERWPEAAKAAVEAATTGQNTQGNAIEKQRVVWTGTFDPQDSGTHKFRLYSSSYVKVYADDELVLDRWRQNWNPWYHNFELALKEDKPVQLRIEWEPNQGYIALEHADPLPEADRHSVSFASEAGRAIDYYVVPAPTMDDAIAGYRRLTGKAPMMPRWAYGFWQSRQRYNTQAELLDVMRMYRDQDIPIDNIVQDWFYWPEDAWGSHAFDPDRFPDPQAMVDEVHDLNGRIMLSVWPKFYPTTENGEELREKGYLYERPLEAGQLDWVGKGYPNTFYDPYPAEARDIYWRQMKDDLLPLGFDAWWMDATEPDWHSNLSVEERKRQMYSAATDTPGAAIFNSYPLVHAEGVFEGLREAQPDTRPFILTRSGFGGVQRASAALWSGDVAARWDDLRDQISAGLNLSVAGVPNWTHDIGGFSVEQRYSSEDPEHLPEWRELYLRWFQFGAFTPLFRSHGEFPLRETPIISEGDPEMRDALIAYHKLRYRLMPYIYTVAAGTHYDDGTMMRPLVMDFEADRATWGIDDEYLFGPSLLVAPVSEYEARSREVYLPQGADWYDARSGAKLAGGQTITAAAPRESMPLFVRAGAIVPMGQDVQWTGENPQGPLTVHVFAGADGAFSLYEDQGTDMGYTRGEYARIPMAWDDATRTLTIGAREGAFPGMAETRAVTVVLHDGTEGGDVFAAEEGRTVTYEGEAVSLAF